MADTTWGVKVAEDFKSEIQEIIDNDFESAKEFMEQLVSIYKLNKTKQLSTVFNTEIEELEGLTRRINNIFINANEKVNSLLETKDIEFNEKMESQKNLIGTLQTRIDTMKGDYLELDDLRNNIANQNSELLERVNHLEEANQNSKALIKEYESKINTLSGIIDEYKGYKEDYSNLQEQLDDKQREINQRISEGNFKSEEIDRLKQEKERIQSSHENMLKSIESQKDLEKEKALLELEKQYQSLIADLRAENNDRIKEMMNREQELVKENKELYSQRYESQEKIRQLESKINTLEKDIEIHKKALNEK